MKRPPGLWILLSAGIFWLSLQNAESVRATALIFGKSTTTTTEVPAVAVETDENGTDAPATTTPQSNLTGNPQIDYMYDPNLPKELNGYNLSDYPFYERVPDEKFDFKCDGLHDGFYASVPHKCQVYHHCLFGTRYDFLCANYTAFDQKTFICHFVSEVDCANSKKYWHRNDALYRAETTTTIRPPYVHTPPPQPPPAITPSGSGAPQRRPSSGGGSRRRPLRRRRPQYEYYDYEAEYDDYYEERPRSRRKRPRPRPRPVYDDDYEEYEDERYERRGSSTRREEDRDRKPYRRRNNERRKQEDDDAKERRYNNRKKTEDEDRRPSPKETEEPHEDRRYNAKKHRKPNDDENRRPSPKETEEPEEDRPYNVQKHRKQNEDEDRQPNAKEPAERRPRPKPRKPVEYQDDDEDVVPVEKPVIKPTSGSSIYDRPRTAPRIKPPVPRNEAGKYAYKPLKTPEREYEDYYEDEPEDRAPAASKIDEPSLKPKFTPRLRPKRPLEHEPITTTRRTTSTTSTTTTTTAKPTTTEKEYPRPESVVRIVKRPFLPSRGGNPLAARGLAAVGSKAEPSTEPAFKASPQLIKHPVQDLKRLRARTTQKPPERNPLDIEENEYDITLNDALNPTLPNLPIRGYPTGFSNADGYHFHASRPRFETAASSDSYVKQRFRDVPVEEYTVQGYQPKITQAYYTGF